MNKTLDEFTRMHNQLLAEWENAIKTGDASPLENMAQHYSVAFFTTKKKNPYVFNRAEALEGLRKSVILSSELQKKFENRIIRMKSSTKAKVFYEQVIERRGQEINRIFTIESWEYDQGWLLTREVEDQL